MITNINVTNTVVQISTHIQTQTMLNYSTRSSSQKSGGRDKLFNTAMKTKKRKGHWSMKSRASAEVKRTEGEIEKGLMEIIDRLENIDSSVSHIWHFWDYRTDWIKYRSVFSHLRSMLSVVLYAAQVLVLLYYVDEYNGDIGDVGEPYFLLLPLLLLSVMYLITYISGLFLMAATFFNSKKHQRMAALFKDVDKYIPIIEQILPVIVYCLVFVCMIAVGSCHLKPDQANAQNGICQTFNIRIVYVTIWTYVGIQVIHHILAIVNNRKHTSMPQRNSQSRSDTNSYKFQKLTKEDSDTLLDEIYEVDTEISAVWSWWKFRMNRIAHADVAHDTCCIWDVLFEGITVFYLLQAIHDSEGDLSTVTDAPRLLIPLYIKFFLKALTQIGMLLYALCNHVAHENTLQFFSVLEEPTKWWRYLIHMIPVGTQILFGCIALAVGQCHINPSLRTGQPICSVLPVVHITVIVILVTAVHVFHHLTVLSHHSRHMERPRRDQDNQVQEFELTADAKSIQGY